MNLFKQLWKLTKAFDEEYLIKSSDKLTEEELVKIQNSIHEMQGKGMNATSIIKYLQNHNEKLADKYKAERAFWTEVKRMDTEQVGESADNLDLDEFKVILSPHACPLCVKKTNNGEKVFKSTDMQKDGFGHVPPFHPNCYCIIVPK